MTPRPAPPPDLAGRWLAKFFTDHLAGERAASPRTVAAYRDAMKLLLTWFKDAERIPPEKLLARHVRAVRARDPGWAPGLPVTPHTLRRSRAMHLIQAGVNLIYIRDLLGHADVSTTEISASARRRGNQTQSDRKCLPATHPRHPARLDLGHLPDRLARLAWL